MERMDLVVPVQQMKSRKDFRTQFQITNTHKKNNDDGTNLTDQCLSSWNVSDRLQLLGRLVKHELARFRERRRELRYKRERIA